jgi:hypothetical protein
LRSRLDSQARHFRSTPILVRGASPFLALLIARSCRETGATLVSRNSIDLPRIAKVFSFEFVAPYPIQGAD